MMEMVMNFCAPLNVWAPDDPVSRVLWDGGAGRQHWGLAQRQVLLVWLSQGKEDEREYPSF